MSQEPVVTVTPGCTWGSWTTKWKVISIRCIIVYGRKCKLIMLECQKPAMKKLDISDIITKSCNLIKSMYIVIDNTKSNVYIIVSYS